MMLVDVDALNVIEKELEALWSVWLGPEINAN